MLVLSRSLVFAVVPLLLCLTGCGKESNGANLVVVTGKLVENGKPFVLDQSKIPLPKGATSAPPGTTGNALRVTFIAEGGEQFVAKTNVETGTFEVLGTTGKGIAPGRYKIALKASFGMGPDSPEYFKGQFSPEKTQIVRDVKAGEEVVIDVAKPQG